MDGEEQEEQLVAAAQRGDKVAQGQLLLSAYDDLVRFLEPRIPAPARRKLSVDDIIQQVFSKAFREMNAFEYRGDGSFRAWLRSIGEFQLRDAVKELQRKKRGGDRVHVEQRASESFVDVMTAIAGDDPTASQVLRHKEARQAMRLAIAELPPDYREVIQLRYFELKSIEEAGELMGRSQASVRALTDRAKKQLREALGRISTYLSTHDR